MLHVFLKLVETREITYTNYVIRSIKSKQNKNLSFIKYNVKKLKAKKNVGV